MEKQVKAGIKALLLCKKNLKKETLLDHDDMKVMLQISAIKVAPGGVKQTVKLPLPVPFTDSADVCLFVKDLKRGIRVDHEKSVRHWRELLDDAGVTRITEVMPLRQLKAEYSMFEARRKLCDAYDVFLSDVCVTRLLPTLLGKHFITKKKQPVSVNMEAKDLTAEIDSVLGAAYLHLHNSGDSSAVQVGRCGQTEQELLQNVLSAVDTLKTKFPGGLHNIRSLHLKLDKSPAVPIFVSDVSANAVPVPAARRQPGSRRGPVTGELSTVRADSDVVVDRFGNVQVVQKRPLSDDEEESDEEEEDFGRGRRGRKRVRPDKKGPAPAAAPAAPAPAAEDSSDEEDRELEAREKQFLDQLSSEKAAKAEKASAASPAEATQKTGKKGKGEQGVAEGKKKGKKGGVKGEVKQQGAGKAEAGGKKAKKGNLSTSPKAEKPSPANKYAKKKGKNIGMIKKIK